MKHPALLFVAVLIAVLVVSVSAFPGRTAPQVSLAWNDEQSQTLQAAGVHSMVGESFHSVSAGF
ncbi:MAG TPA: hypothetical protein VNW15_08200 [Rhizomicrobium sp.]|jgi:hypothetical protein|nr:hypothetical protein [Rhizomicrobium sp.]